MNDRLPKLTREEISKIEIGRTETSKALARFLTVFFLAAILVVPVIQHVREVLQWRAGWRSSPAPQAWEIFPSVRRALSTWRRSPLGAWERTLTANRQLLSDMEQYVDRLETESWLHVALLPPSQYVLSRYLRVGNEQTYVGERQWLFYRPGVDYLTGAGFLPSPDSEGGTGDGEMMDPGRQSNPVEAIVRFRDQLATRGVHLIVLPVPGKASIHPERFASAFKGRSVTVQNPAYEPFLKELEGKGVQVFPLDDLLAAWTRASGKPAFLATDTHWTPAAMMFVAARLAEEIGPRLSPSPGEPRFQHSQVTVRNLGDLGMMLKLPPDTPWPSRESVSVYPVHETAGGARWAPDPAAEVLLLGDSFSNIYSLASMGWGAGGGFAEHLSHALDRAVDAIVRNDEGAHATREILARDLARGVDRLVGKKVLIWQFAQRELAQGDWKLIDLALAPPKLAGAHGLRRLTGARTRVVWMQGMDPISVEISGEGSQFRLMGLDTEDGLGARVILEGPLSCWKPMMSPDGGAVVYTDLVHGKIIVVNWDGSGRREIAEARAVDVVTDPADGSRWVYAIEGPIDSRTESGRPVVRFRLDRPAVREVVWDMSEVSLDNFQISSDCRRAAGLFPWPNAAVADLERGVLDPIGRGCWTSLAPDNRYTAWFFDGAHRNLTMVDAVSGKSWTVPIHHAPGVRGYEVYHPRWGNHRRFFGMSGPYKGGEGETMLGAGGEEVEIYVGRFSADLHRVERWTQVTKNDLPDFFPDVWVDPSSPPAFDASDVDPPHDAVGAVAAGAAVVEARLRAITRMPTLQSIAPYRQALVVYEYEVTKVHDGVDPGPRILVLHWAIRNDRPVAPGWGIGETRRLVLEPFESRHELQGERVISDIEEQVWPMFYALESDAVGERVHPETNGETIPESARFRMEK